VRIDPRRIGFTATQPHSVSRAATANPRHAFPQSLDDLEFGRSLSSSPPEFLRSDSSLGPSGPSFTCLGSFPSSRHHSRAATFHEGSQVLVTVRPRVFSTPRRFSPRASLRACFISQPRPGCILFRGFFLRAATLPRRKEPAPLPLETLCSPPCGGCHSELPRLRGLHLREAAFRWRGCSPRTRPLPTSGFSPPGPPSRL
jgi:hypothetical protein